MGLVSTRRRARPTKSSRRAKFGPTGAKSAARTGRIVRNRPAPRARVRIVRSRPTRARRTRPLPSPESLSERMFQDSLERSLRDYRTVWEALAKR